MDPVIAAAGRALAAGDPLGALRHVALREDAPALALRGTAMAQLGDFERARALLRCAARAFGSRDIVARARCAVADAEIALASRDLRGNADSLDDAHSVLAAHGDRTNAAHAQFLKARFLLLVGRLDAAELALARADPASLPAALQAAHSLALAGVAMRRVQARAAHAALDRAQRFARMAGVPALVAETEAAARMLQAPAARLVLNGQDRPLVLAEVESLMASPAFVVDACRYTACQAGKVVPLATRPVLFALLRALAEAWPDDVSRDALVTRAFRLKQADDALRARLRVEMGRLRKSLRAMADVRATQRGFVLQPRHARKVVVLAQPFESKHAAVLALLADGEAWSSSALAVALGMSQRNVQRAVDALAAAGKIQPIGRGRARRWLTPPLAGFTTALLLPAPLALD